MKTDIFKVIIYSLTAILATWIWHYTEIAKTNTRSAAEEAKTNAQCAAEVTKGEMSRYTIESGSSASAPLALLLDKKTGRVWRFYRENDEKTGRLIKDGFTLLKE